MEAEYDIDNEVKINVVDQAGNSAGVTYSCYEEKVVTGQNQEYANEKFLLENTKYCKSIIGPQSNVKFRQNLSAGNITVD